MDNIPNEILTVIIAVIVILVFIALFVMVMLVYFNNKKLRDIREKEKMKQDYEQALLQTQLEVQEHTMRQISQEIHDNVGQVLSLVNLNLKTMSAYEADKIDNTSVLVNKAITDLRNLSRSLNPENIARQGIIQVLRNELNQLEATGKYQTSLNVEDEIALPPNRAVILYRMIQEMISNIIRHSEATEVKASITKTSLSISDNGRGFNITDDSKGIGLQNLKQRATTIGGSLEVNAVGGKGTIITFNLDNIEK
jgi:two-component system NarL family sensor kinase